MIACRAMFSWVSHSIGYWAIGNLGLCQIWHDIVYSTTVIHHGYGFELTNHTPSHTIHPHILIHHYEWPNSTLSHLSRKFTWSESFVSFLPFFAFWRICDLIAWELLYTPVTFVSKLTSWFTDKFYSYLYEWLYEIIYEALGMAQGKHSHHMNFKPHTKTGKKYICVSSQYIIDSISWK